MTIPNYVVIQELGGNEWYTLSRGRRIGDQTPVLLKTARQSLHGVAARELLEGEFETLCALSIEGVPRAYELSSHDESCHLVLEDRGGLPLQSRLTSHRGDLDFFFKG